MLVFNQERHEVLRVSVADNIEFNNGSAVRQAHLGKKDEIVLDLVVKMARAVVTKGRAMILLVVQELTSHAETADSATVVLRWPTI